MKKHLQNILSFVVIFLIVNMVISFFFPQNKEADVQNTVTLVPIHKDFEVGGTVSVELKNNTQTPVTLKNRCPDEPLTVLKEQDGQWVEKHHRAKISCEGTADVTVKPGEKHTVAFTNWSYALFGETGKYKVQAIIDLESAGPENATQQDATLTVGTQETAETPATASPLTKVVESAEFEIKPQGWLGWIWTAVFYQPLYNILVFFISIAPWNDLGIAIILLTLLIRTILLVPNQKALESQRKMQEVQPKLNHIREKYKDNQEMIGKETLAIMQEHKVNPLGSCLPLLIQFPVLIALFYVVQNGLNPDTAHLLYAPLQNFDFNRISVNFLGMLDLTKINPFILPLFVGGLQFLQMKLAVVRGKKKEASGEKPAKKNEMDAANNMMLYFMPAMIAVFTASVPAGVGLYWSVSTLYGIGQQLVVNAKADKDKTRVRVIETHSNS
jgi:YidC/Oxa1 family membrane protein insertase